MRQCIQSTLDCPYLTTTQMDGKTIKTCHLPEDLICSTTPLTTSQEPTAGSVVVEKQAANS